MYRFFSFTFCFLSVSPAFGEMATGIDVSGTNITLSCNWTPGYVKHGYVEAATSTNLAWNSWAYFNSWTVATNVTNITVCVPLAPGEKKRFWRFSAWSDMDGDGLSEESELSLYHTDPRMGDTDGDGLPDDFEVALGTDPNVADFDDAPKTTVGIGGAFSSLRAALTNAAPYAVIELQAGVYSWSGIDLPTVPVLLTSPDAGRNRQVVLRDTYNATYQLGIHNGARSVIRGIYFDLSESRALSSVWIGGSLPWSGTAGSVRIENCYFRLPRNTVGNGVIAYLYTPKLLTISDCIFDAAGSCGAVGIRLYNSNPAAIERCTFVNFPPFTGAEDAFGIFYTSALTHFTEGVEFIPMAVKSCLFDDSFDGALAVAKGEGAALYDVSLADCIIPATNTLEYALASHVTNLVVATGAATAHGLLPSSSPAIDAGGPVSLGAFDIKGQPRGSAPDIGAAEYTGDDTWDTDGDGMADVQESATGTNPFLPDSDFDGVADGTEVAHLSDATNRAVVCFNLTASVTNHIPKSLNPVCALLTTNEEGRARLSGEYPLTNYPVAVIEFGHTIHDFSEPLYLGVKLSDGDATWQGSNLLLTNRVQVSSHDATAGGAPRVEIAQHAGSNTAYYAAIHAIDDRIAGLNPTNSLRKFLDYQTNGTNFVLNPLFWAADIDTSCASMWNNSRWSTKGHYCDYWTKAGTAISKRHIIAAYHYGLPVGTTLWFMGTNGCAYTRHVTGLQAVTNTDILIESLDSELPDAVMPVKILPANYSEYLDDGRGLPVATFDQEEKLLVAETYAFPPFEKRTSVIEAYSPNNLTRKAFFEYVIGGDSGNPRFLILGNQLVLLCTMRYGWGGSGDFVTHFKTEIQNTMNALCPGYQLEEVDLSDYEKWYE